MTIKLPVGEPHLLPSWFGHMVGAWSVDWYGRLVSWRSMRHITNALYVQAGLLPAAMP